MFEALHAAAPALGVKVLGDCGGALVPAGGPATEEALRQELSAARSGAGAAAAPAVLVLCPGPGAEAEAALLQAAASALAEVAPGRWLLVRTAAPADAPAARQQRRRLAALAAAAVSTKRGDAANRTSNYTVCDPVCHKHVSRADRGWRAGADSRLCRLGCALATQACAAAGCRACFSRSSWLRLSCTHPLKTLDPACR